MSILIKGEADILYVGPQYSYVIGMHHQAGTTYYATAHVKTDFVRLNDNLQKYNVDTDGADSRKLYRDSTVTTGAPRRNLRLVQ